MVNKNKLLSRMIDCGFDSQRKFAEAIGMNKDTLNLKINNKSDFKTGKIDKICKVLNIVSDKEKVNIFCNIRPKNRTVAYNINPCKRQQGEDYKKYYIKFSVPKSYSPLLSDGNFYFDIA